MKEHIPPIRFSSRNLRFIFFFDTGSLVWFRKDLKKATQADDREADEALDLALREPIGFA